MTGPREVRQQSIFQFLSMIADMASPDRSCAQFLLDRAVYFEPAPLPPSLKRLAPKRCFENAQKSILASLRAGREPLVYAEGYACSGTLNVSFPIHHAWLVTPDGNVVDQTWESPETSTYFGVAFSSDYVELKSRSSKHDWSLLENREDGWELLRNPEVARTALVPMPVSTVVSFR